MKKYVLIAVTCVVIALAAIVAIMWARNTNQVANFDDCVKRGYIVDGDNPRRCTTPEGRIFTEDKTDVQTPSNQNNQAKEIALVVYFAKNPESNDNFEYTVSVDRSTTRRDTGAFAIEQLIAGPSASEQAKGLFSPLSGKISGPSDCSGRDFTLTIENSIAKLRFCRTVSSAGIGDDARISTTIGATLKQFSTVEKVIILTKSGDCFGDQSGLNRCLDS